MNELVQQLQRIYVLLDDGERRALRGENLTPTQFTLLRCVDEDTTHALSISRLAEMMLCTRGNVTRLVRRLEVLGLVSTRGHDQDQRLVLVSLTSNGSKRLGRARRLLDTVNARRFHGMSPKELRALSELTDTVAEILAKDLADLGEAAEEG
jgi:MarR family 2-MHQ and catechol resistance regulon transcriptional repressor